jgi:hypothetical protein
MIMGLVTTSPVFTPINIKYEELRCGEMSRILSAALVDRQFCELLLKNPDLAISNGYNGESFVLSANERQFVEDTSFSSLPDLAQRWVNLNC